MALESQLNAVMIEEGHYTVGETKKGRHNDAGDEKRTKAVVNQPKLAMYHIDMKYIRDLHRADDKVPSVSPQIGKANRVFLVTRYKKLCQKELIWCRKNQNDIVNKANLIYKMYSSGEQFSARSRCVNYPKLEGVCHKYNSKEI